MTSEVLIVGHPAGPAAVQVRALTSLRPAWRLRLVADIDAALEQLERRPARVVLAQLGGDVPAFARLFAAVSERCPGAVRLAMIGADALGAGSLPADIPLAHQCIPATADAALLRVVLDAALGVAEQMARHPAVCRLLSGLRDVPSPPALYFDIREQLQARAGTLDDLTAIASRDPALVARVLKVANSGFYALPRTVNDLTGAISMIGTEALLALVLSSHLFGGLPPPGVNLDTLWRHALEVSKLARDIARADGASRAVQNSAAMAGLLHDVGLLVLLQNEAARYQPLWRRAAGDEAALVRLEREVFGIGHQDLGALILTLWCLPDDVVRAVRCSHAGAAGADPGVPSLVPTQAGRAVMAAEWLLSSAGEPVPVAAPSGLGEVSAPDFAHWQQLRTDVSAQGRAGVGARIADAHRAG